MISYSPGPQNTPLVFSPPGVFGYKAYLRSSEQYLNKTLLREKLCSSLLLISFLSCAGAEKEIKLLPARCTVKPWTFQCQHCYLVPKNLSVAFTSELTREGYRLARPSLGKAPALIHNEARTQVIVIIWKCDCLVTRRCAGARPKDWPLEVRICSLAEPRVLASPAPKALWMLLLRIFKGMLRMFLMVYVAIQNRDKYNRKNLL